MIDFENLPKVVAIVGSRDYGPLSWVSNCVNRLKSNTIVVSGGAKGVDSVAEATTKARKATQNDIYFKPFNVEDFEWKLLGITVGLTRNELLVRYVKRYGGAVIIFATMTNNELTGGSKNDKEWCEKLQVPYTVIPWSKK